MFYIRKEGKTIGPFPPEKMGELAADGSLNAGTEVSKDKTNWCRADSVLDVFKEINKAAGSLKKETPAPETTERHIKIRNTPNKNSQNEVKSSNGKTYEKTREYSEIFAAQERKLNPLEFFWNPVVFIPEIGGRLGDGKSGALGAALTAAAAVYFFTSMLLCPQYSPPSLHWKLLLCITPSAGILFANFACRAFLGAENKGGFGLDALVSGAALILPAASLLLSSLMLCGELFFRRYGVFISAALFVYSINFMVLVLHTGATRISGIPESVAPIAVPLEVAVCILSTALVCRYSGSGLL